MRRERQLETEYRRHEGKLQQRHEYKFDWYLGTYRITWSDWYDVTDESLLKAFTEAI